MRPRMNKQTCQTQSFRNVMVGIIGPRDRTKENDLVSPMKRKVVSTEVSYQFIQGRCGWEQCWEMWEGRRSEKKLSCVHKRTLTRGLLWGLFLGVMGITLQATHLSTFFHIVILFTSKIIDESNTFTQWAWLKDRTKQCNSKEKHNHNPIISGALKYIHTYKDTHLHTHTHIIHTKKTVMAHEHLQILSKQTLLSFF